MELGNAVNMLIADQISAASIVENKNINPSYNVQKSMGVFLLAMVMCGGQSMEGYKFNFWTVAILSFAIMLGLLFGGSIKILRAISGISTRLRTLLSEKSISNLQKSF